MKEKIEIISNKNRCKSITYGDFSENVASAVLKYHKSLPAYRTTPLLRLSAAANRLGLNSFYVKDESKRFSLNAFKALGGSYAIGKNVGERLGISDITFDSLTAKASKEALKNMTFCTATDGNHGRSVAWTANMLGAKSEVLMPKGTAKERLLNVLKEGSNAYITELNYDDTVRLAFKTAKEKGYTVIQDTTADGYSEVPKMIMQGYLTLAKEITDELSAAPTHIFLQAGVGSFAGAMAAYFRNFYGDSPIITVAEPNRADCIFRTAKANDGKLHFVTGEMDTIMAGLACGEPCEIGYGILKNAVDFFVSVPDTVAELGMRSLYFPHGDEVCISGESGAVTSGLVFALMTDDSYKEIKEKLKLSKNSRVLCISTEGDTDKESFKRIISK